MSENTVARLRECIEYHALGLHPKYGPPSTLPHIERDTFSALLDIVEAMAEHGPSLGEYYHCTYCGAETAVKTRYHAPDCPYRRARELCGMEQDGAE